MKSESPLLRILSRNSSLRCLYVDSLFVLDTPRERENIRRRLADRSIGI